MARTVKNPEERKNEILDAAEAMFIEKGYNDTSIKDIINKVGVAHGLFYYYFDSKIDVLNAIVNRYWQEICDNLENIVLDQSMDSVKKMEEVFLRGIMMKEKKMDILSYVVKLEDPLFLDSVLRYGKKLFVPILTKIVEQGREEGVFNLDNPEDTLELFFMGSTYAYDYAMLKEDPLKYQEKVIGLYDILERMLGAKKGTFHNLRETIRTMIKMVLDKHYQNLVG